MATYNPFNPNSTVTPTLFAGRSEQTLQIVRKLAQVKRGMSSNFIFHGERGIGKTALARLIRYISESNNPDLENLNFLTSYYSVEKGQHFRTVLQAVLNQLTDKLPKPSIERLSERLGDLFNKGKFSFGAFGVNVAVDSGQMGLPLDGDNLEQYFKDQAVSVLTNILMGLKEEEEQKKYDGLLVILDEVHNAKDIQGIAQLIRSITTTLDVNGLGNISFIIIGYSEAIQIFFEGDPSARRSFDSISLTGMPHEEAKEVLSKGFKEAQIEYDEKVLDEKIKFAGGYPHSLQVLGHNLIEVDTDNYIGAEDWGEAIREAAKELQDKDFLNLYDFKGKKKLREEIMNILAWVSFPVPKSILAKEFPSNIYTSSCLPELKKSGAVREDPETGDLTLHSSLFRSAILLHIINKPGFIEENWIKISDKINNILMPAEKKE
jgi:Cdc6-like AAA superfamily ATPase